MKDLIKVATEIRDAFEYNPGHSDLDNEQPIHFCIPLGTWRRLNYALMNLEPDDGGITQALVQMARDNALAEARTAPEAGFLPPSDGLEMVPAVPTVAMREAGEEAHYRGYLNKDVDVWSIYTAMLRASLPQVEKP